MSPWADPTLSGESITGTAAVDPALTPDGLRRRAVDYVGAGDRTAELVSPSFADLTGLPPLLIQAGSHEILVDDATTLAPAPPRPTSPSGSKSHPAFHMCSKVRRDARRSRRCPDQRRRVLARAPRWSKVHESLSRPPRALRRTRPPTRVMCDTNAGLASTTVRALLVARSPGSARRGSDRKALAPLQSADTKALAAKQRRADRVSRAGGDERACRAAVTHTCLRAQACFRVSPQWRAECWAGALPRRSPVGHYVEPRGSRSASSIMSPSGPRT
jgi:alpha/beta hydrolase fold